MITITESKELNNFYVPAEGYTFLIPINNFSEYYIYAVTNNIPCKREAGGLLVTVPKNNLLYDRKYEVILKSKWNDDINLVFYQYQKGVSIIDPLLGLNITVCSSTAEGGIIVLFVNSDSHLKSYTRGLRISLFRNCYSVYVPETEDEQSYTVIFYVGDKTIERKLEINLAGETKTPSVKLSYSNIKSTDSTFVISYTLYNADSIGLSYNPDELSCSDDSTSKKITCTCGTNTTTSSRDFEVKVTPKSGTTSGATQTAKVTQAAASYTFSVSPSSYKFTTSNNSSKEFTVTSTGTSGESLGWNYDNPTWGTITVSGNKLTVASGENAGNSRTEEIILTLDESNKTCKISLSQVAKGVTKYKIYYGCDEDAPSDFSGAAYLELAATGTNTSQNVTGGNKCIWLAVPSDVFHVDGIYNSTFITKDILRQFQNNSTHTQYLYIQYNNMNYIIYAKRNPNAFQVSQYFKFNIVSGATTYYTITFKDDDGTLLYTYTYQYGLDPIIPIDPYREGYTFDCWTPSLTTVTKDQEYIATYKENS